MLSICLIVYLLIGCGVYGSLMKDYFSDGEVGPRDFYMTIIFWPIILVILFGQHIGRK
jgi:uncharacterized membrane protein